MKRPARSRGIVLVAIVASAILFIWGKVSFGSDPFRKHRAGRVAMNLPLNGALGVRGGDEALPGLRWPREGGTEFLGSGGFYVRFLTDGGAREVTVAPGDFVPVDKAFARMGYYEGCKGGKRFPDRERDDDGDGSVDEDPPDGVDNDGDGFVDEDFAAIGDEMVVTRSFHAASGLLLGQSSFIWNHGHVRDFIGFTTILECRDGAEKPISNLHVAMFIDFQIGDPDAARRGDDDRFFLVKPGGRARTEGIEPPAVPVMAVAADGESGRGMVGIAVLGAGGPGGERLGAGLRILKAGDGPDSLLCAPLLEGAPYGEEEFTGDMAVGCVLDTLAALSPGEFIRMDWFLVFGRSREELLKKAYRAIETYRGVVDDTGKRHNWIVPARKAVRVELEAAPASAWLRGGRRPAAAIALPPSLEDEEVEWVRGRGFGPLEYEQVGSKILVTLDSAMQERGEPFLEGQLSDGTIFLVSLGEELFAGAGAGGVLPEGALPEESMQLFPNPFFSSLKISLHIYDISKLGLEGGIIEGGSGSVRVYDVRGRLVRTIMDEEFLPPGDYSFGWDGLDDKGVEVAPGVYYCKLQIGLRAVTKRVILLR